jgi:hypothetical protein
MTSSPGSRRLLRPPSGGTPPPETATLPDGKTVELRPLAVEVCRRYRDEYPDEAARYGDAGIAWCVHDVQYMLSWAALDATWGAVLHEKLRWLARVLGARGFPLERLARSLELAGHVVDERGLSGLAERLRAGGETVLSLAATAREST